MTTMWLLSLFAIVLSFAGINVGDNTNLFIFPTPSGLGSNFVGDLSWILGSTQKIQWTTTVDSYQIYLWQQAIDQAAAWRLESIYGIDRGGTGQHDFDWQVQIYNSNLTFSPVYFLWFNPDGSDNFTSHYFNITGPAQSSSSTSSSTASTSSTSSTTSTIASSISSTPPPSPTSPTSETVKVGLGVGLGIGIPLVLIAGLWIGLNLVKQRRSSSTGTSSDVPLTQVPNNNNPPDSYFPPNESLYYADQIHEADGGSHKSHEVSGEREPVELGSRES